MNRILASFHPNTPGSVTELRAARGAADWPAAAAIAHKLRPSLRLLGAAGLNPYLVALETHAPSPEATRSGAADQLAAGLEALLAALPAELEEGSGPG